jgi:hypothetical protein
MQWYTQGPGGDAARVKEDEEKNKRKIKYEEEEEGKEDKEQHTARRSEGGRAVIAPGKISTRIAHAREGVVAGRTVILCGAAWPFETDFHLDILEAVGFPELDEAGHVQGAAGHALRFSDAVPDWQEDDAEQQEHDDGDVKNFGLNLRLDGHDASGESEIRRWMWKKLKAAGGSFILQRTFCGVSLELAADAAV